MNLRYAVFDMDGTLINSLIIWDVIWTKFGEKYRCDPSFRPTPDDDRRVRTMTMLDAMNYIDETYHFGVGGAELDRYASEICADFYEHDVQMKDGALDFVRALQKNGVRMCIATATDMKLIRIAIKHLKLDEYFETVLSCAEIGKGKDQPDIYLAALHHFGADAKDVWVFEDSAVALVTAKSIGMHTVGLFDACNYGQDILQREADFYIADGETLMRLVDNDLI